MKNWFILLTFRAVIISTFILYFTACTTVDVFEKNTSVPLQEWQRSFKPSVSLNIEDTVALYNIYVTLRHTHSYSYNNIWLNVDYQLPGDTTRQQRVDIELANSQKGWLGTGMDDIYEVRRLITPRPYQFKKKGVCTFTLEQIMRDDPLRHVMNAGIRVEKVKR